jgi:hypothetical protein
MSMPRVVASEVLDHLPAGDPAAQRSRRDLLRVHAAMGTRAIVSREWQALVSPHRASRPLQVLEIGAGDGRMLLGVARMLAPAWPRVHLSLLDHQQLVSDATLAGFTELGWAVRVKAVDVFDWAASPDVAAPSRPSTRWDLVSANLFVHHFQGGPLGALLSAVAAQADRFVACEPRRSLWALAGSRLVGVLGSNAVTREDAVLSVRAGFRGRELTRLWPGPTADWQSREHAAVLFSHCFATCRRELAP